jgi:ribosomal protein L32
LCGHPKDKISRHRASLRRRIYYRKPQHNLAVCKFCQAAASPHTFLQGSGRCNGRCIDDADGGRGGGGAIEKEGGGGGRYRAEYVPPC